MSYLLTEIALEMLGYKFYDIYGIQDEINNFQRHSNDRSSESNSNEANLAQLLGINIDSGDRNPRINQNKEIFEEVNAIIPEPLTKLMDSEYNKVRQQVLDNKPNIVDSQNVQGIVQSFIAAEHERLRLEHQNLRNFRKLVEKNLLQINPTTFEKYSQTFKPARKQLKKLDANKK